MTALTTVSGRHPDSADPRVLVGGCADAVRACVGRGAIKGEQGAAEQDEEGGGDASWQFIGAGLLQRHATSLTQGGLRGAAAGPHRAPRWWISNQSRWMR